MPVPALFQGRLAVPAIAAPMFLVSGPDLVINACKAAGISLERAHVGQIVGCLHGCH